MRQASEDGWRASVMRAEVDKSMAFPIAISFAARRRLWSHLVKSGEGQASLKLGNDGNHTTLSHFDALLISISGRAV